MCRARGTTASTRIAGLHVESRNLDDIAGGPGQAAEPVESSTNDPLRVESLDGLRGVAAGAVLVGHALLASIATQDRFFVFPLNGGEAVIVFFALSGFVLALPASRGRPFTAAYYPRRFVRLYFPVWGALAFGALAHVLVSRHAMSGESWWLKAQAIPLNASSTSSNATLFVKAGGFDNNPALWSLRWEVIFSALLPLFLLVAALARRRAIIAAATVLAAFVVIRLSGSSQIPSFLHPFAQYLPVFALGSVMAFHADRLVALRGALSAKSLRSTATKMVLLAGCLTCLTADWWLNAKLVNPALMSALVAAGACLAVILAIVLAPAVRFLSASPTQWLGKRSFSLYLVHAPLVVTLAFATHGRLSPPVFLLVAIPLALLVAELFFRLIEWPSHRLSRSVGTRARTFAARGRATT